MFGNTLSLCLTSDEKKLFPGHVLKKLEKQLSSSNIEVVHLKVELGKLKGNYGQQTDKLENELTKFRSQLSEAGSSNAKIQHKLKIYEEQSLSINNALLQANKRNSSLMEQLVSCQSAASGSPTDVSTIESKVIIGLKSQIKVLEEQLNAAVNAKCLALLQAEESNSLKIHFQFKETRFEQEKEMLDGQMQLLLSQLEEHSKEVSILRIEHSNSVLNLQSDLANSMDELTAVTYKSDTLQKSLEAKFEKVAELTKLLNDSRKSELCLEQSFHQELDAKESLTLIYKDESDIRGKKCTELEQSTKEVRHLLQETSMQCDTYKKALDGAEVDYKAKLDQSTIECNKQKEELERLNSILNRDGDKEDMCSDDDVAPTVAASERLMRKDLTRTQLYLEYFDVSDKLLKSKEENKRLTRYMNQILEEIELKAPMLRQQRDDYAMALHNIEIMHKKNDDYIEEMEKLRYQAEEREELIKTLTHKADQLNIQSDNLSRQISSLLILVESSKGGQEKSSVNGGDDTRDEDLVLFKDVSELQENNKQLLALLNDFKAKRRDEHNEEAASLTKDIKEELDSAYHELNLLKIVKNSLEGKVKSLESQCDHFKIMVNRQQIDVTEKDLDTDPGRSVSAKEFENVKSELEKVKKELENVCREHEIYREEKCKNDQLEKQELDRIRKIYKKLSNENVHLESDVKNNAECLKSLQESNESYQRQLKAVENNNEILHNIIAKHESTISSLREQVLDLTRKQVKAEFSCSSLKEEVTYLKDTEARLRAERESFHQSQFKYSLVSLNLESIKNNLEKKDSENLMRAENMVTNLLEENDELKKKFENNNELKLVQSRLKSTGETLEFLRTELESSQKSLADANLTISQLKGQQQGVKTPIILNRPRATPITAPVSTPAPVVAAEKVNELQGQLNAERYKVATLKTESVQAQATIACLKKVLAEQEAEQGESSNSESGNKEEVTTLRRNVALYTSKVTTLTQKLKASEENVKLLKDDMNDKLMKMTEDLEERENELEEVQKRMEEAEEKEKMATTQMEESKWISEDSQDKYRREVILHGADLKAIATLKENYSTHNAQTEKLNREHLMAQEALAEAKTDFVTREAKLKKSQAAAVERASELEKQNKNLLQEFTKLSDGMADVKSMFDQGNIEGANTSFSEEEEKSSHQLREIVKYLRREFEICASKANLTDAELQRILVQKKSLESQVCRLSNELSEEVSMNMLLDAKGGQNTELLRKVQMMDALSDSNCILRREKYDLKRSLEESLTKVNALEDELLPLQKKSKDLSGRVTEYKTQFDNLQQERDTLLKKCRVLEAKLSKIHPGALQNLQEQVKNFRKSLAERDAELQKTKTQITNTQKKSQQQIAAKNEQVEEVKRRFEQSEEKVKVANEQIEEIRIAKVKSDEKCKEQFSSIAALENTVRQLNIVKESEKRKILGLFTQITTVKKNEESLREEIASGKSESEAQVEKIRDVELSLTAANTKIENNEKQIVQLRKIATKYKKMSETVASSGSETLGVDEDSNASTSLSTKEDNTKELEERNVTLKNENEAQKEHINDLEERLSDVRAKLEGEINRPQLVNISELQQQLDDKLEEVLKSKAIVSQLKANINRHINSFNEVQDDHDQKMEKIGSEHEMKITSIQNENVNLLNKLHMREKQIEMMQRQQQQMASKGSSLPLGQEKSSTEPPPTANIKPMSSPVIPVVTSPRLQSQSLSQGTSGMSRSIPTASVKPMAPLSGGDGAVSSTVVTLPQATVTPTSSVASTTSQSFSSTRTTTVAQVQVPVPGGSYVTAPTQRSVSSTLTQGSTSQVVGPDNALSQSQSSSDLVSQALALIAPQGLEEMEKEISLPGSSGTQKRKIRDESDDEDSQEQEEVKRSRVDEGQEQGEPSSSSSSSHLGRKRNMVDVNLEMMLSSDEEETVPSSQGGANDDVIDDDGMEDQRDEDSDRSPQESGESHGEARPTMQTVETVRDIPQQTPSTSHEPSSSSSRPPLSSLNSIRYDESEDRIVPSTPTFLSRTEAAQNDRVSSPQVPTSGFVFGTPRGFSLSRDGDTPQQSHESAPDGNISSSGGEGASDTSLGHQSGTEGTEAGAGSSEADAECGIVEEPDSGLDRSRSDGEDSNRQNELESNSSCVESSEQRGNQRNRDSTEDQEGDDDDEEEPDEGESTSEVSSPRAPRIVRVSGAVDQQPQSSNSLIGGRRIIPITWDSADEPPSPSRSRGGRVSTSPQSAREQPQQPNASVAAAAAAIPRGAQTRGAPSSRRLRLFGRRGGN